MRQASKLGFSESIARALGVSSVLALLVGCFQLEPGHIDPSSIPLDHTCFDGSAIELVRYSSACARTSKSLAAEVRDGMVFSAHDVRTLESPCADGPNPAIEVSFDITSHSLLLDFSQVTQSDRFPEADFEGYIFEVVLEEANGLLVAVTIDEEISNFNLDDRDIEWDSSHIEVNFEGTHYDRHSLLKLDLLFARVSPVSE